MPNKKISEFPLTPTLADNDIFLIDHIGSTSTVSFSTVSNTISNTVSSVVVNSLTDDTVVQKLSSNFIKKPASASSGQVLTYDGGTSIWVASAVPSVNNDFTGSNQSVGTSGYQKLPGGLIIQWGTGTGDTAFTFPIPFTTACYSCVINPVAGMGVGVAANNISKTGATPRTNAGNGNAVGYSITWIAIGV